MEFKYENNQDASVRSGDSYRRCRARPLLSCRNILASDHLYGKQLLHLCSAAAMTDCSVMRIDKRSKTEVLHKDKGITSSEKFAQYVESADKASNVREVGFRVMMELTCLELGAKQIERRNWSVRPGVPALESISSGIKYRAPICPAPRMNSSSMGQLRARQGPGPGGKHCWGNPRFGPKRKGVQQ